MAKARRSKRGGSSCPKALKCPKPMAVASLAGKQARTCADKNAALDLWMAAASAEVARNPAKARAVDRAFDLKSRAVQKFCSSSAARKAAAEAAHEAREQARFNGLGRARKRRSR